jgi:multidrug transporter EmrE-like cation transporter
MSKYFLLLLPVLFSTVAQLLIKKAAFIELRSLSWYTIMAFSMASYFFSFILYAAAVRYFPISVASPVNTIAVMLLVVLGGVVFWSEPVGLRHAVGLGLGLFALILLLSGG